MSNFQHCHVDQKTGLMWCRYPSGSWAPPFEVGPKGSSDDVKENFTICQDDEIKRT
jgi:hypothetical protein